MHQLLFRKGRDCLLFFFHANFEEDEDETETLHGRTMGDTETLHGRTMAAHTNSNLVHRHSETTCTSSSTFGQLNSINNNSSSGSGSGSSDNLVHSNNNFNNNNNNNNNRSSSSSCSSGSNNESSVGVKAKNSMKFAPATVSERS